jgi:hypothetical protein
VTHFLIATSKVAVNVLHELLHRPATVVTGNIGMEVFPSSLDAVVIRAIGREEVQLDSRTVLLRKAPQSPIIASRGVTWRLTVTVRLGAWNYF